MSESTKASSFQIYLRLLSYVKPYKAYFAISMLGMTIFALSQPAFAKLLDYFVQALDTGEIMLIQQLPWLAYTGISATYLVPMLLIFIAIFRGIGSFLGGYFMSKLSLSVVHDLRTELFNHMIKLPNVFFDNNNSGYLIARITHNVNMVTDAASDALRITAREGLTVIFLLGFLVYTNWKLTLTFICIGPIIALVVSKASKRFRNISHGIQSSMGELTQVTSESINGYREVKSFGGEEYESARFTAASNNNRAKELKMKRTSAVHTPLLQLIVSAALAGLLLVVLKFQTGASTATLIGFVSAAALLPKSIRQLSEVNSKIQKGIAAAENVFKLIDEPPEVNNGTHSSEQISGHIELKNVNFSYDNAEQRALKNINFTIEPGQTVALVGRSGSGKTTLANLIPRFYDLKEGSILIDGVDINEYDLQNLRSHIALVNQQVILFNDTVARNIAYGAQLGQHEEEDIYLAAEAAYANDFISKLPEGLNTLIGEDGVLLSGGQRQRLAIARAILKDAPILIMDEATSALDTESERHIQAALDEVMKNRTTLVIAHRLSTIESADCILVMDNGCIVEHGTHEELLVKGQHYAALHKMQFRDDAPEGIVLQQI